MRWIRRSASIFAILGGILFLVLPVAFLNGTVLLITPRLPVPHYTGFLCHGCYVAQSPSPLHDGVAFAMILLGSIGILLGTLGLKLSTRPGVGLVVGLAYFLGSLSVLTWASTAYVMRTFVTTPAGFLMFSEISVVAMGLATALLGYELLRRWREIIPAITS